MRSRYPSRMHTHPATLPLTEDDVHYIHTGYVPIEALCAGRALTPGLLQAWIAEGRLPQAPYVLPDGTARFPRDELALFDAAGGVDGMPELFARRYRGIAREYGAPASGEEIIAEWEGYLSGAYAVCLLEVVPENIFRKERLVARLGALLAEPRPLDAAWCAQLRDDVDILDTLERMFAPCDRVRFGGPVSRDRLITAPKAAWPFVFALGATA